MILKGNQRGGATSMGLHLLRTDENDHVEVHQIRGFVARDVVDALREAQAVSRGTRCKQFMFSLSLSPPETETVENATFERAIDEIENTLGLAGQPRVIVFHEKNGRRHSHCVWSRVDGQMMKAINLSHYKLRLKDMSRKLYLEHGWRMPRGLVSQAERDPFSFSREEWQQARRAQRDPKILKEVFKDCWAISDSGKSFRQALSAHGLYLAQGDRRGYVAVDWRGEVFSVSRWSEVATKAVAQRLDGVNDIPELAAVKSQIASRIRMQFSAFATLEHSIFSTRMLELRKARDRLVAEQRLERHELRAQQQVQRDALHRECATRFRKGIAGIWDWISGARRRTRIKNESMIAAHEVAAAVRQADVRKRQLSDRHALHVHVREARRRYEKEVAETQREQVASLSAVQADPASERCSQQTPHIRSRRRGPEI